MFGRQSGLVGSSGGSGSSLVEFRAGRMNMVGKMVHPDTRKGLVYLTQSEDGLIHFCWKDRGTGKVEDDLIVFPDDCVFKRIETVKTGRVFVLKFKSSTRRLFFWLQEPKTDKDEEYCRRVNEIMNNPPSANRSSNESGDLQYMLNNMSQQQLMQLFGGVGQIGGLSSLLGSMNRSENSSSRTASTPTGRSNSSAVTASGGSNNTPKTPDNTVPLSRTPSAPKGAISPETSTNRTVNIDLSTVLSSSEAVTKLISDPDSASALSVHLPNTGSDDTSKQQLKDTISSPQFQQALSLFSSALQSGQLGPVVSQFQLSSEAVAAANTDANYTLAKCLGSYSNSILDRHQ
ncbi:unnamed protein product [Hermetia illucens]|uniref:Proteasomal ubiquitin receptor ADRM1 homolog n=1 Tax=Hermetia illucens TaxID=343691 RepID=A0A7R8UWC0_HERIL|nr:unnamed protein product [Hermetia illucens]